LLTWSSTHYTTASNESTKRQSMRVWLMLQFQLTVSYSGMILWF